MTLYHPEGVEFNKNKTQRLIANSDVMLVRRCVLNVRYAKRFS